MLLADSGSFSRSLRSQDKLVVRLAEYFRASRSLLAAGYSEQDTWYKLADRYPDLVTIGEFWSNRNNLSGISLQAHLLTELSDAEIAQQFHIREQDVRLFADLFFDVRDRLDNLHYIAAHVIGPVFQSGIDSINPVLLARYFGYFGGSLVLQRVIYGLSRTIPLRSDDEVLGYLESVVQHNTTLQAAISITVHQPTRFDIRPLLEGFAAIKTINQDDNSNQEQSWITEVVGAIRSWRDIPRDQVAYADYRQQTGLDVSQFATEPRNFEKQAVIDGTLSKQDLIDSHKSYALDDPQHGEIIVSVGS